MPLIHNFKGLNGYCARESGSRVVGLSIVRPTTKQWGKVEVGLGFGNILNIMLSLINEFQGALVTFFQVMWKTY